jgi:capsular exopolysaccharide synthesis family protein
VDLRDYLRAIRKRWWLVVGALATAVGVAVTITLLTPPTYAASVTFFVSTRGSEITQAFQGGQFAQQRVKSYVDVLTSNRLARAMVADVPGTISAEQVQTQITAQVVPDTVLVEATVTDRDRARALQLAQTLAREFPKLITVLETPPGARLPTVGVQIIAEPRLADTPVAPQPLRNVGLAVALGLIVGVGAAALRESLDRTLRSPEALNTAAAAAVLSAIPYDQKAERAPLITEGSAHSKRAEAMRQLRTNLQFVNVDRPVRSIVVSSPLPGEGKSSTVCNLAIAFAEAGRKVLVIDADLRRSRIAEYFGLEGAVGLTNVLAGRVPVRDALQAWGDTGLWVLPSGHVAPNPSELLGSGNMADLLSTLCVSFDVIVIDTPPLLPVTDAAVMATLADGCLLIARHGKTTNHQATKAAGALHAVGARVLGCVLTMTPAKGTEAYDYYSYGPDEPAPEAVSGGTQPPPVVPARKQIGKMAPPSAPPMPPAVGRAQPAVPAPDIESPTQEMKVAPRNRRQSEDQTATRPVNPLRNRR